MISAHSFNIELSCTLGTYHNNKKSGIAYLQRQKYGQSADEAERTLKAALFLRFTLVMFLTHSFILGAFGVELLQFSCVYFMLEVVTCTQSVQVKQNIELHHTEGSGQVCRNKNNNLVRMHTHNFDTQHHEN